MTETTWHPRVGEQVRITDSTWAHGGTTGIIEGVHDSDGIAWFSVRGDEEPYFSVFTLTELEFIPVVNSPPIAVQSVVDAILRDTLADSPVTLRGVMEYIDDLREHLQVLEQGMRDIQSTTVLSSTSQGWSVCTDIADQVMNNTYAVPDRDKVRTLEERNAALEAALTEIANMDGYDKNLRYIDEWTEAAAFSEAQQIAAAVLKHERDDAREG